MSYGVGDVWAAGTSPNGRLVCGEQGFDRGSNHGHEATSEEASKGGGELERSLAAGGVSSFLLWDPYAEVYTGPNGVAGVQMGVVRAMEALTDEAGDEGYAAVVYFVWPIVHTGRGSRRAEDVFGDV